MRRLCLVITGGILLGCKERHLLTKPVVWFRYFGMRNVVAELSILQARIVNEESPRYSAAFTKAPAIDILVMDPMAAQIGPSEQRWRQETLFAWQLSLPWPESSRQLQRFSL
jgi:hypothetical protein